MMANDGHRFVLRMFQVQIFALFGNRFVKHTKVTSTNVIVHVYLNLDSVRFFCVCSSLK